MDLNILQVTDFLGILFAYEYMDLLFVPLIISENLSVLIFTLISQVQNQ
jgi:hypothetical protein